MKQMYEIFQSTNPDFSQVYKEISFIREQLILLQFTLTKQAIYARNGVEANGRTNTQGFFWGRGRGDGLSYFRNKIGTSL